MRTSTHADRPRRGGTPLAGRVAASLVAACAVLLPACARAQLQPVETKPFAQALGLQGIGFDVSSRNAAAGNTVRVVPSGLQIDNSPIEMPVSGQVMGAEVADLDADGSPELYVYVQGPGPDRRGSLLAFGANKRKSLSLVTLPALDTHRGAAKGYRGGDEMAVVENRFVRRFPLYGKGGDASRPTGRTRQLLYKLARGEASWVLRLDRMTEY